MIEYSPFWNTLKNSTESTYTLITKYHVSSATIDKLRKNKPMNTTTLNDLCRIFDCQIQDNTCKSALQAFFFPCRVS